MQNHKDGMKRKRQKRDEEIMKAINEIKACDKKERPVLKAICVEEYDSLRERLKIRLKEIGESGRDFKIQFTLLKYNSEIVSEIIKNGGIDLVIMDLDQYPNDPIATTSEIRAFGWYIPILFASVELAKSSKAVSLLFAQDLIYAKNYPSLAPHAPLNSNLMQIKELISSNTSSDKNINLEKILFPTINNLIYEGVDKHKLYLSGGNRIIYSIIKRARAIKNLVESIIDKNGSDPKD